MKQRGGRTGEGEGEGGAERPRYLIKAQYLHWLRHKATATGSRWSDREMFRKIYLFGFHKIQAPLRLSYRCIPSIPIARPPPDDPVSPTDSRFRELAISVTRAIDYGTRLILFIRNRLTSYNLRRECYFSRAIILL